MEKNNMSPIEKAQKLLMLFVSITKNIPVAKECALKCVVEIIASVPQKWITLDLDGTPELIDDKYWFKVKEELEKI